MTMNPQHTTATASQEELVIRFAEESDAVALDRLAQLEGRRLAAGRMLVAEVDGNVLAALPLAGGPALADPFRPTAALVEMLRMRRGAGCGGRRRRLPRGNRRKRFPVVAPG